MIQQENNPKAATNRAKLSETCGNCHKDVVDHYKKSQHGIEMMKNNPKAPSCADCHGEHDIKSVITSSEFSKINQVELCLKCHQEQKLPHKNFKGEEGLVSHYKDSYHYKALLEGKTGAATCSDCHGSHDMKKDSDPASTINKKNIPQTCGQSNCHVKQLSEYTGSIHEVAITKKNNPDAPNCTDCHGKHQIAKKDEKSNRISNSKGIVQLCSDCHNSVELTSKYNLPLGRTDTYMNSYHGLATRGGSKLAAECASCHGFHNIRDSKDSLSMINKKNLPETCSKCHPGASEILFNTPIHQTNLKKDSPIVDVIQKFYLVLIFLIIGGMVLHNVLDFIRKSKKHKAKRAEEERR
jgi:nitrate/TMAO reductase-like tetraheme cytochrome c subunit